MSTSIVPAGLPDKIGQSVKSFWQRPEGKVGLTILCLGALTIGALTWASILPFLVNMMQDTIHLGILVAEIAAACWVLTSKRTHMVFRLAMRWLTGLIITIDPIGILKDRLQEMRKRREKMEEQISSVSGSVRLLKETITKNHAQAEKSMSEAAYARKQATSAADSAEQLRMALQIKVRGNKAARLETANVGYSQLLTKLQSIYDFLVKWAAHLDAYIEDTADTVRQEEIRYKTLNTAYGAMKTAMRVIRGNAQEEDIYNSTMEYLADEAGRKLGEIEDFQRVATNFMDNIDIANGAVTEDAMKQLDAYEKKLLLPENSDTHFLLPGVTQAPQIFEGELVPAKTATANAYSSLFRK